jgi:DNA-binding MarR family transcriptional regulator
MEAFLEGKVPRAPRRQSILQWTESSRHRIARALRAALEMTHGETTLLGALLQYPAFSTDELANLTGLGRRSVRDALTRMKTKRLVETLPLFEGERRSVLTDQGLDLLASKAMQTPARFRARRSWSVGHEPLTRSPRHMEYILEFMFALRKGGHLGRWDLVQARYGYCIAVAPGDLTRPRHISIVPDSSGTLMFEGREVPFWLEIDRGTRNGVRLTRQLEKYILARFGYAASDPVPMLLYVVAEGGETRARLVARRLVELASRYRLGRMPAILVTTWELLTQGELSGQPEPLQPVWRLPFHWREFIWPVPPALSAVAIGLRKPAMAQRSNEESVLVQSLS